MRSGREWAAKHIEGSTNLPLNHLQEHIGEIPRNRRIAVHCAGGYRSSIAASLLHQNGLTNLIEMAGGLAAWEAGESYRWLPKRKRGLLSRRRFCTAWLIGFENVRR